MQSLIYKTIKDRTILDSIVGHYVALTPIKNELKTAYRNYVVRKASPFISPVAVSKEQAEALHLAYSSRPQAAKLSWIEEINYNALLSCPFCGGDGARTIEHYLPQKSYPEFAVFSLNLMPSCGDCNRKRNDSNKYGALIQLLHPYFDRELLNKLTLYTSINFKHGIPNFQLDYEKESFNEDQQERIDHHISTNVDEISFLNKTLGELEALKVESEKYKDAENFLNDYISDKIYLYTRIGAVNAWGQTLCRGIARLEEDEINSLFHANFGKRLKPI